MFKKATKTGSRLWCALFGPAGSGKTFTALRIATGIGGSIAVIDTERGSASKYADRFNFDVCELNDYRIESYLKALEAATAYDIVIIDSLTHSWQELLAEIAVIAKRPNVKNSFAAWAEGTPKQRRFINRMLNGSQHVIATMRSNTEWQTCNDGGKLKPVRIGLKPEQGKEIEFEFDILLQLDEQHVAYVLKDRSGRYPNAYAIESPGEEFGRDLINWLMSDSLPPPPLRTVVENTYAETKKDGPPPMEDTPQHPVGRPGMPKIAAPPPGYSISDDTPSRTPQTTARPGAAGPPKNVTF